MSARFDVRSTALDGVVVLERRPIGDNRGFFQRLYCADELRAVLGDRTIAQVNHTRTTRPGTVRGLHFQRAPHAETKVVSCLRGEIFDVAVDLRRGSPTFLEWHAEILSETNHRSLVIPEGFAHGFQTLTENCELLYLHTATYAPGAEGGIGPRDARVSVAWPRDIAELSPRDSAHPPLDDAFVGLDV